MKKIFFLKAISDWCLPPKIKNFLGNFIKGKKNWYFKGNYNSWNEAVKYSTGYADEKILNRVLESVLKVKNGEAVFERDSVLFDEIQYSWPLLSGLLWSAALQKNELNILDFGGALGTSYFQNKKFFSEFTNYSWNIVDQQSFVKAGKEKIEDNNLKFYFDVEHCFQEKKINVAIFSGVLDVIPDPYDILKKIVSKKIDTIIIDRTTFLSEKYDLNEDNYVTMVVSSNIYPAILPYRHLSYKKIINFFLDSGYSLIESFQSIGGFGDAWEFRGLILKKIQKN